MDRTIADTENKPVRLEDAVEILVSSTRSIDSFEEVPLSEAAGRTLAEEIKAGFNQPPFPRSPLDGYAVRASDTSGASEAAPVLLKVIAEVDAGHHFDGTLAPGEAVRIMTGAPIPDGADAIIGQEDTDYGEKEVSIYAEMKPHQNYCDSGEDFRKGDVLLAEREFIGPVECGIIASLGKSSVRVYRRPKVLLISTGDEVIMPGEKLTAGKIYDSNLFMAAAQLTEWGAEISGALHSGDDPDDLIRILESRVDEADIIVTTGGVSVGKKDILHDVFRMMDIERLFWRISIKPGMAMLCGKYRDKLILSLSGNPYAAYIDLHMAVRPVIDALNGNHHLEMKRTEAVLMSGYDKKSYVRRFVRACVNDGKAFIEGHTGGNGTVYSGHGTNALIDIPAGTGGLSAGDKVSVLLL